MFKIEKPWDGRTVPYGEGFNQRNEAFVYVPWRPKQDELAYLDDRIYYSKGVLITAAFQRPNTDTTYYWGIQTGGSYRSSEAKFSTRQEAVADAKRFLADKEESLK